MSPLKALSNDVHRNLEKPLAEIAAETGFADQPHMTRAITALTGAPPRAWRGALAQGLYP